VVIKLRNMDYEFVNCDEREKANKPFISQVAEPHIDSIINARHKWKQKMQWTREGAYNVCKLEQVWQVMNEWEEKWPELAMPKLEKVA